MTTQQRGEIAQLKVQLRAAEKGFIVSLPTLDCRYDLIIDTGERLLRAQVKWGAGASVNSNSVIVSLKRWAGDKRWESRTYQPEEVDLLLVYIPRVDKVLAFAPDIFCGKPNLYIRCSPSRNNQVAKTLPYENFIW